MPQKISLTGIKPTGAPHWGNYFGAIKPALELAEAPECEAYYFIADYHALTGVFDPEALRTSIHEVACSWIAMGLKTDQIALYKQSDIPEILELNWILACSASKGLLNRAHAYKALRDQNLAANHDADFKVSMGVFNYPVLMAADILFINADIVPVGEDQLQHIEIARDIAQVFNNRYGEVLKLPTAFVQKNKPTIPGLDQRKMSKSYNNHIPLFINEKKLRKTIMRIKTDSSAPTEPKNPDSCSIFALYKLFANQDQIASLRASYLEGIGWGDAKQILFEAANSFLAEPRAHYEELMHEPSKIDRILAEGRDKVRPRAIETLRQVKSAVGLSP